MTSIGCGWVEGKDAIGIFETDWSGADTENIRLWEIGGIARCISSSTQEHRAFDSLNHILAWWRDHPDIPSSAGGVLLDFLAKWPAFIEDCQ